jgi:SAM-dependent methyltransferase
MTDNPASWTAMQRMESAFFNEYWSDLVQQGKMEPLVSPDEVLIRRDLGHSLAYVLDRLGDLGGARVLELGCGLGDYTVVLARRGAFVEAVDLSSTALRITQQRTDINGLNGRVKVHLTPAEKLEFPDATFDWAVGFGLLHHADLDALGAELVRVLKPKAGRALFREPLGTNPFLTFARRHLPYRDKYHSPHEHPLTYQDIRSLGKHFQSTAIREFYLFSMFSRLVGGEGSSLFRLLWALDEFLIRHLPAVRPLCRYVTIEFRV